MAETDWSTPSKSVQGCEPIIAVDRKTVIHPLRKLWFAADLYGAFPVKGFSLAVGRLIADCRLGFADSSLFGAEEAVLRPVACDQVPGARGRGQGTKR